MMRSAKGMNCSASARSTARGSSFAASTSASAAMNGGGAVTPEVMAAAKSACLEEK